MDMCRFVDMWMQLLLWLYVREVGCACVWKGIAYLLENTFRISAIFKRYRFFFIFVVLASCIRVCVVQGHGHVSDASASFLLYRFCGLRRSEHTGFFRTELGCWWLLVHNQSGVIQVALTELLIIWWGHALRPRGRTTVLRPELRSCALLVEQSQIESCSDRRDLPKRSRHMKILHYS